MSRIEENRFSLIEINVWLKCFLKRIMKIFAALTILAFAGTIQCNSAKKNTAKVIGLVGTIANIIYVRLEDDHKILLTDEVSRQSYTKSMFDTQRVIIDLANRTIKQNPDGLPRTCNWSQIAAFGDAAWKLYTEYAVNPPKNMVDKQGRIGQAGKIQKSISTLVTLCLRSLS